MVVKAARSVGLEFSSVWSCASASPTVGPAGVPSHCCVSAWSGADCCESDEPTRCCCIAATCLPSCSAPAWAGVVLLVAGVALAPDSAASAAAVAPASACVSSAASVAPASACVSSAGAVASASECMASAAAAAAASSCMASAMSASVVPAAEEASPCSSSPSDGTAGAGPCPGSSSSGADRVRLARPLFTGATLLGMVAKPRQSSTCGAECKPT